MERRDVENLLTPCCKCGKDWIKEDELIDTVYPSKRDHYTGGFTEWNVVCQIHNTGCGRVVYGSSEEEAVERWNACYTDEIDEFFLHYHVSGTKND